jgi:hypothetical protein
MIKYFLLRLLVGLLIVNLVIVTTDFLTKVIMPYLLPYI